MADAVSESFGYIIRFRAMQNRLSESSGAHKNRIERLSELAQVKLSAGDGNTDCTIPVDPVVMLLRRQLLNRCQQEFQKEKDYKKEFEEKKVLIQKHCNHEEVVLSLEKLEMDLKKWKRKSVGNCRFIGELFKLDFLTERIMHSCIESLLKNSKDEHSLECMCQLLTTIGRKMDHETGQNLMDQYFKRIQYMVDLRQTSSRIRFMLQDVIDLRANKWLAKKEIGPKTIDMIHKEAREEDRNIKIEAAMLKDRNTRERRKQNNTGADTEQCSQQNCNGGNSSHAGSK